MTEEKHDELKPVAATGFSIIEKVSQLRWTLQFAQAVLFADLLTLWTAGHGILDWAASTDQLARNAGGVTVAVLAFGVLVSIVFPIAADLVRSLLLLIPFPVWMRTQRDHRPYSGCVRPWELRKRALKENSTFLLDLYNEHSDRRARAETAQIESGTLVFSVIVLSIANSQAHWFGLGGVSLLESLQTGMGGYGNAIFMMAFFIAALALKWTWFPDHDPGWIYYPPLYEELDAKRRETFPPPTPQWALHRSEEAE